MQNKNNKPLRLYADIETSLMKVWAFSCGFNLNINHDQIIEERKIICIAYKWEGEKDVTVLRWDKDQDDRSMLEEFVSVANDADEIVGHYGDHFDWPWIRTRILFHKLPPIPIWKTVDTKAIASKYFYFNSNKLDYISDFLGHGKKLKTDFGLWVKVSEGCKRSLNYMCKYCGVDVKRLESVFKDLQPFIPAATHAGVTQGLEKWTCPHTGSKSVKLSKRRVTASGQTKYQMQNTDTGAFYSITQTAFNEYQKRNLPKVRGASTKNPRKGGGN